MQTRTPTKDTDIFLDEHEYLIGPLQGLYKTSKNARKYIISGLNSIDEQLKVITYASFSNTLNRDHAITTIDHWITYLQTMKREIARFQNLSDFEQDALRKRIDYINAKHEQLLRETTNTSSASNDSNPNLAPYHDDYPLYCFPYSVHDKALLNDHRDHRDQRGKKGQRVQKSLKRGNHDDDGNGDVVMDDSKESKDDHAPNKNGNHSNNGNNGQNTNHPMHPSTPRPLTNHNRNDPRSISKRSKMNKMMMAKTKNRHYKAVWMDRLLIDYLCRNGHFETAYALSDNHDLKVLSNIRLYHKIRDPLQAIQSRNAVAIIKWCRSNKTLLKEHPSHLEFMARSRVVVELLRNGQVVEAAAYITTEMSKDLETRSLDENDASTQWKWDRISQLFTCSMFVPTLFTENEKYHKLQRAKRQMMSERSQRREFYEKCKIDFKEDAKRRVPHHVYKLLFKPKYYWDRIEAEFWRIFKVIYGLNEHSMLEYVVSCSLQTLLTPYCYHKEWQHPNCIACKGGRNKMGRVAHKSHIRGIELPNSYIVCDVPSDIDHHQVKNKEYDVIRRCMVDNEQSVRIKTNAQAVLTPNGCVIDRNAADTLIGTNQFVHKDYEKVYMFYGLI